MAENNWVLQDGRSILVEFDAAQAAKNWGWFGMRSSGEGIEFEIAATPWTDFDWLDRHGMIMAGEAPPVGGSLFNRMLLGVGL